MYIIDKKRYFCAVFNTRENRTQILFYQIQKAETISLPRTNIADDTKYNLIITAYNVFGTSQSDPVSLCVKEISKFSFLITI